MAFLSIWLIPSIQFRWSHGSTASLPPHSPKSCFQTGFGALFRTSFRAVLRPTQRSMRQMPKPISCTAYRLVLKACGPLLRPVSYTHLRAHETVLDLVCRLLLEK